MKGVFRFLSSTGLIICLLFIFMISEASATMMFFTDRTSFNAQLSSSSLIDFESYSFGHHTSILDSGVTFRSSLPTINVTILEPNSVTSITLDSTILATGGDPIVMDLPSGVSAFGGTFGEFGSLTSGSESSSLALYGPSGVLDSRTITLGSMVSGEYPKTFFGWISTDRNDYTKVEFLSNYGSIGVDDIQFGTAKPVPEPTTMLLFGAGLASLGVFRKKFRKR
jgi:hypothetical protein